MEKTKKENKKRKTIRNKILKTSISVLAISLFIIGSFSIYFNLTSTIGSLKQAMEETVLIAANGVSKELQIYKTLACEISANKLFISDTAATEEILEECNLIANRNNIIGVDIVDTSGIVLETKENIKNLDYFSRVKETLQPYISDPIIRKDNSEAVIMISAPIIKENIFHGVVVLEINASFLSDIVKDISIGEFGNAAILNSKGTTIGYADFQLVLDGYNTQVEVKNDSSLKKLAKIEQNMMNIASGETGFESYSYDGMEKYMAYTSIPETNGWSMDVSIKKSEFLNNTYLTAIFTFVIIILAVLISIFILIHLSSSISSPIKQCVDRIKLLAQGDIHSPVPEIDSEDETGILAQNTAMLVNDLQKVITDIDYLLGEMANGNFSSNSNAEENYIGDFKNIKSSILKLNDTLSNTLKQIRTAANQVSIGSSQMAENAQDLAEGATDQAGAVEELLATITDVSEQTKLNAAAAIDAFTQAKEINQAVNKSSEELKIMAQAMERIKETSKRINEIISSIEDIASQTNLLSLNAAIEAARAGEAGRGFSVVADEIRKLAEQSAQAAINTTTLINSSIIEVEQGSNLTENTVNSLFKVIEGVNTILTSIDEVKDTAGQQAETMEQLKLGIDQISGVVQNNSAAAQESSATSEELSAQATALNELVEQFTIED